MNVQDTVLQEAASWVGYLEKKSNAQLEDFTANAGYNNYTIFAEWYQTWWGANYQAQPWCAVFVSCVFRRTFGQDLFPAFAYCPTGVNNFKKAGQWVTKNPRAGDIIFFADSAGVACHVGIVERADRDKVDTIEGNTSVGSGVIANGGGVYRKSYGTGSGSILGYGRPNYDEGELSVTQYEELSKKLDALAERIPEPPMVYNYIDKNMPEWARSTVQKLADRGVLRGDADGLGLTDELLRMLVVLDRAGCFAG